MIDFRPPHYITIYSRIRRFIVFRLLKKEEYTFRAWTTTSFRALTTTSRWEHNYLTLEQCQKLHKEHIEKGHNAEFEVNNQAMRDEKVRELAKILSNEIAKEIK